MLPYPQIDPVALSIGPIGIYLKNLMVIVPLLGVIVLYGRRKLFERFSQEKLVWVSIALLVVGCLLPIGSSSLEFGPIKIHWYGLMYLIGIGGAWWLASRRVNAFAPTWNKEKLSDLVFWVAMGVILGGRLGYVLFYDLAAYIAEPVRMLRIWEGGMSFHGGLIGVMLSTWWFGKRNGKSFFELMDFIAPLVPIGLGAGRIGNFINAELWGKATDLPWAMVFPTDPQQLARHPSQLYQFALEGVALFAILWFYSRKPRPTMAVSGMFALCYGIFRFIVEFVRVPDAQLGYLAGGWLTMGQVLCLPMILGGLGLIAYAYKRQAAQEAVQ